ncbi:MAG TPA: hypothetical protein VF395_01680 [Polyangiaceae bacterium]
MATQAWEEAAVDFKGRGTGRLAALGRWFVHLSLIGALTAGTAFYLPLYRAHRALTANHALALDRTRVLESDLTRTQKELSAVRAARAELENRNEEARSQTTARATHLAEALATARAKLKPFLDRKVLVVDLRGDKLVVSFAPGVVQGLETSNAPAFAARLGLCEITGLFTNESGNDDVDVTAYADPAAALLDTPTSSARDVSARLANRIAETLESKCRFPAGRATAIVRGRPGPTNATLELSVDVVR